MFKSRGFYENEIIERLEEIAAKEVLAERSIHSFSTRLSGELWLVEFKFLAFNNYTIKLKRSEKTRYFKTLDAVANWMKKVGVSEFLVVL